jgi:hypothetical protein
VGEESEFPFSGRVVQGGRLERWSVAAILLWGLEDWPIRVSPILIASYVGSEKCSCLLTLFGVVQQMQESLVDSRNLATLP